MHPRQFGVVIRVWVAVGVLAAALGGSASFAATKAKAKRRVGSVQPTTTKPKTSDGTMKGLLKYPADVLPADLVLCLEKLNPGAQSGRRCSDEPGVKEKGRIEVDLEAGTFTAVTAPGVYYVYGQTADAATGGVTRGYYTEFMRCGLKDSCLSHRAIRVQVIPAGKVTGIVCCDFWVDVAQQRKD